jgi:hypothetical protein
MNEKTKVNKLKELTKRPADTMVDRLKEVVRNDRKRIKERRDE